MSVTLRKRKNGDGTTSLVLDIYVGKKRRYEFLKTLKLAKPTTEADRRDNKKKLQIAQEYASKKLLQLAEGIYEHKSNDKKSILAVVWMQDYIDNYTKKDKRNMSGARSRFAAYIKKRPLTIGEITETDVMGYRDYLVKTCEGEGAASYFSRFKKMMKQAYRENIFTKNPAEMVKAPKGKARVKEVLSVDEIQKLAKTETRSTDVKNAFLLCCLTGLRWIDIIALRWRNINLETNDLKLRQVKTGEDLAIKLNPSASSILNKIPKRGAEDLIFKLPTQDGANKVLRLWVARAKIGKKITWHCARHSFGTNLIYHGNDVFVTSRLLGHTSLKHTQRYLRAADDLKQQAVNKLPDIEI